MWLQLKGDVKGTGRGTTFSFTSYISLLYSNIKKANAVKSNVNRLYGRVCSARHKGELIRLFRRAIWQTDSRPYSWSKASKIYTKILKVIDSIKPVSV